KDSAGPEATATYIEFNPGQAEYTFVNTGPGTWAAANHDFVQLSINPNTGDFEIRNPDGMIRTYFPPSDPNSPGRLKQMRDRNDNRMTFHYEEIDPDGIPGSGDEKYVLAFLIDSLGREVRYQYYAATSQVVNGRTLTI